MFSSGFFLQGSMTPWGHLTILNALTAASYTPIGIKVIGQSGATLKNGRLLWDKLPPFMAGSCEIRIPAPSASLPLSSRPVELCGQPAPQLSVR